MYSIPGYHRICRRSCISTPQWCALACAVALGLIPATYARDEETVAEATPLPTAKESTAPEHQGEIAVRTWDLGAGAKLKMALLTAGSFIMGTGTTPERMLVTYGGREADYRNEYPQRQVRVEKPFYIGTREVTVGQFRRFVEFTGYRTEAEEKGWSYAWRQDHWEKVRGMTWKSPGFAQGDDHPVVCVTWSDCVEFCRWISKHLETAFRLPS
jgi:formylglycine-generating enzyme required for sulfatase activity